MAKKIFIIQLVDDDPSKVPHDATVFPPSLIHDATWAAAIIRKMKRMIRAAEVEVR